jgi:hypothetical protein
VAELAGERGASDQLSSVVMSFIVGALRLVKLGDGHADNLEIVLRPTL